MKNNRFNNASYILHLNTRSLLPVIDQLRMLFDESKSLITAISELGLMVLSLTSKSTLMDIRSNVWIGHLKEVELLCIFEMVLNFKQRSDLEDPKVEAICAEIKIRKVE